MLIPRFFSEPILNNVVLTAGATAVVLFVSIVLTAVLRWIVNRTTRSARSEHVKDAVEQIRKSLRYSTIVISLLAVVAGGATLAVSILKEIDLHPWANRLADLLRVSSGWDLLQGLVIAAAVVIGWLLLRRILRWLLTRVEVALLSFPPLKSRQEKIPPLRQRVASFANIALLYLSYRVGTQWLELPPTIHWLLTTVLYVILILSFAGAAAPLAIITLEVLDQVGTQHAEQSPFSAYYAGIRKLWPLANRILEAVLYLGAVTLIVRQFQTLESFVPYGPRIIRLLTTFFVARVMIELTRVLIAETFTRNTDLNDEGSKRRVTLVYLIQSIITYVIYFGAVLIMMSQIGIDTKPFLAGAGIIGLAVGLGAQKLVNDMVSGFFILFEGHLLKGDYVRLGDVEGTVDSVQLRVTMIRDGVGRLYTFRNGDIGTIINFCRDYVHGVVDIPVDHDNNLSQVFEALVEAGQRLQKSHPERVMEKLVVRGLHQILSSGLVIRVAIKLHVGDPEPISRALRKHIVETFNERGVKMSNVGLLSVSVSHNPPERPDPVDAASPALPPAERV